jgi:hypothetical protein
MIRPQDADSGGKPPINPKSLFLQMERSLRKVPPGAVGESQECYYDAMEADSEEEELHLLSRAVELDPGNTVFAWAKVLERFLAGEPDQALKALAAAQKQNTFTKAYVLGHRKIPKNLPDGYSPGSKEEAACFAADLQSAWNAHPAAKKWLATMIPKS